MILTREQVEQLVFPLSYESFATLLEHDTALRAEVERLQADLSDALDVKARCGPTVLTSLMQDRDTWKAKCERLEQRLKIAEFKEMDECSRAEDFKRQLAACREALQSLVDVQNGPPLFKYEKAWNEAMEQAQQALKGGE